MATADCSPTPELPRQHASLGRIDARWGVVLAVAAYYVWQWRTLDRFVVAIDHCELLFCDFVRHYYPMGEEIFATARPVDGFFYSPFAAILFRPLSLVSLDTAIWFWGAIQLAAVVALYTIPGELPLQSKRHRLIYVFLVLTSMPVLHNFKWGQVSVLLTLCIVMALYLYQRERVGWAAMLVAAAIAVKSLYVMFLLYFVFRRDAKFVALVIAFMLLFGLAVPGVLLGWQATSQFYASVSAASAEALRTWVRGDINSQYFPHVMARLIGRSGGELLWVALGNGIAVANVAVLYWSMTRLHLRYETYWAATLLFTALPFVVPTSWPHYFVYLPIVQVFALTVMAQQTPQRLRSAVRLCVLASMGLSNILTFNVVGRAAFATSGCLFFSNLLILIPTYVCLLSQARHARVA